MMSKRFSAWCRFPKPTLVVLLVAVVAAGVGYWQVHPVDRQAPAAPAQPLITLQKPTPPVATLPHVNCAAVPCLALTFDDGPDPSVTPHILDELHKQGVHATFFLVGVRAARFPMVVRQIYQAGDEIGNHSWNHPDLTKLSPTDVEAQVSLAQGAIMAAGVPAPYLFRPPYGALNSMVRSHIPMALAMWNVDPEDWGVNDPKQISDRIVAHAAPGRVVDLHDIHQPTADALGMALPVLKQHYQLVTFSQLFDIAPGQHGEFYGR